MMEMLPASKLKATSSPPSGFSARLTGDFPTSRSASSLSFFKSMLATWPDPEQETNALLESGRMAMSSGWMQMAMAERTARRAVSMMETVLSARLLTTTADAVGGNGG